MTNPADSGIPANVDTAPVEITILRIQWFPVSATYTFVPLGSTTRSLAKLNIASVNPAPLANPAADVDPANVDAVVIASGIVIVLIALVSESEIYKIPDEFIAIPLGFLNCTSVPLPSTDPDVDEPTTVVTFPEVLSTLRIRRLPESVTNNFPFVSFITIATGVLNCALVPIASV